VARPRILIKGISPAKETPQQEDLSAIHLSKTRSRSRLPKRKATRKNPAHIEFVKSLPCCVPGCLSWDTSDPHHVRTAANSGTGLKPPDSGHTVPMCHDHHLEYHQIGKRTFQAKHGIDLAQIASELIERPPPGLM
jgi:hypothetical protein